MSDRDPLILAVSLCLFHALVVELHRANASSPRRAGRVPSAATGAGGHVCLDWRIKLGLDFQSLTAAEPKAKTHNEIGLSGADRMEGTFSRTSPCRSEPPGSRCTTFKYAPLSLLQYACLTCTKGDCHLALFFADSWSFCWHFIRSINVQSSCFTDGTRVLRQYVCTRGLCVYIYIFTVSR